MYLTVYEYLEYTGVGEDGHEEFNRFSFKAEKELEKATFGRVKALSEVPTCVKRCLCELIRFFAECSKNGNTPSISSFSNDGYSVTFADRKEQQSQIADIIYTYLAEDENNLLYCGVD